MKLKIFFAFVGIYIIWGSTFLGISYGLKGFPPFILSTLRFLVAGILMIGFFWFRGESPSSINNWKRNFIPGILMLTVGVGLTAWAEQYISSTETAIIMAIEPFWFILFDRKNIRKYFSNPLIIIGLVIGLGGLFLFLKDSLNFSDFSNSNSLRNKGFVALFITTIVWVVGSLYSKNKPSSHSTFMNVGQQLFIGGCGSLLISLSLGEWKSFSIDAVPTEAWVAILYLVIFGSIIAYLSFMWLLTVMPPAIVGTNTYVNPVVAVFLGWIIANEKISQTQLIGLLIILIGVLLTNYSNYATKKSN